MGKFAVLKDKTLKIVNMVLLAIVCIAYVLWVFNANLYIQPYLIAGLVGIGIALVLLAIYSFIDGGKFLKIIAYILIGLAFLISVIMFVFTSEYDEPYNQSGRYRPIMSNYASKIVRDIRKDLSADKILEFDESLIKEENDDYTAHIITFFERYDIEGHFHNEYKSEEEQIDVYQEYFYYDRIIRNNVSYESWIKKDFYKFSEDLYINGEKDGIEYQYVYKRLDGNLAYFIVYMQDEDTVFAMQMRIKSQDRIYFDKEKAMENVLSAVNENGIMKVGEE